MIRLLISALLLVFVVYGLWSTFEDDVPASALRAVQPLAEELGDELAPAIDDGKRVSRQALHVVAEAAGDGVRAVDAARGARAAGAEGLGGQVPPGDAGINWYKEGGE